ncbi:hypothetical protein MPER_08948 [Moniliophthora perniciosa FA553]|nr:hypothetical protein MPER_08948 [Moniliophthora perniciosa FA553]
MAIPPTRLQQILDQWNTHPSEVKTWPRPLESETQYTVEHWLDFIEMGCLKRDIQHCQYVEAAIFFLRDDFGETVRAVSRRHPLQSWDMFRMFIVELQGVFC